MYQHRQCRSNRSDQMPTAYRFILLGIFVLSSVLLARAQDSPVVATESVTDAAAQDTAADSQATETVVEKPPFLYSLKRALHPVTLFEVGPKALFRSAESGSINKWMMRKPDPNKISGIQFGIDSAGAGSGFGLDVMPYHKDLLKRGIQVKLPLLYTYKRYELYEFIGSVPIARTRLQDRLSVDIATSYGSRTRDNFFGIGNDTRPENETRFRTVTRSVSAGVTAQLDKSWRAGVHFGYHNTGVTSPLSGDSAQDRFDDSSAPGLFTGAALRTISFSVGRSTESVENRSFRGGFDQLDISLHESTDGGEFGFWQYHFESRHFFPLTKDGRSLIATKGYIETNVTQPGRGIPFFDMPYVGSWSTLRGFETLRFRDKSALALTLEYRRRIWRAIDGGLFVDTGQVAPAIGDFGLDRFHTGYGARVFFWAKPDFPVSLDYARSSETWRLFLNVTRRF
jgi:hypothetical protein